MHQNSAPAKPFVKALPKVVRTSAVAKVTPSKAPSKAAPLALTPPSSEPSLAKAVPAHADDWETF